MRMAEEWLPTKLCKEGCGKGVWEREREKECVCVCETRAKCLTTHSLALLFFGRSNHLLMTSNTASVDLEGGEDVEKAESEQVALQGVLAASLTVVSCSKT